MTDTESTEGTEQSPEETLDYEAALAKLNEEYDRERPEQTQTEDTSELAALKAKIADLESAVQGDQTEKAINEALRIVKGDVELAISDRYLRKLVVGEVSDNATLMRAYANRGKNPEGWKTALKAMGREFQKDFGKKESTETSDIEAVEASVRGQHTQTAPKSVPKLPSNPTFQQVAEWKKGVLGS